MAKKFLSVFLLCCLLCASIAQSGSAILPVATDAGGKNYIRWVDFDVTYQALEDAMNTDIETYEQDLHVSWVDILAYLAAKYGGDFSAYRFSDMESLVEALNSGSSMEDLTAQMKSYDYYHQAYTAVIGNFLGLREDGSYGLTVYSPLAPGYGYTESDDFGNGRSYGFARKHLGHDMFCSVGTPVTAVESGVVEALGWNQYGGWRIGIRSLDGFRYYYYAHLRKDAPYAEDLQEGDRVKAGQIIGYSGQTGYSLKENVNNINVPHLHFGMQLIFDESQKECNSEIWIDTYALVRLLSAHQKTAGGTETAAAAKTAAAKTEAAEDAEKDDGGIAVPILMYHALTRRESKVNDYTIPVSLFESDVRYLKEHGYTAITMTELIDYVYGEKQASLPEKPVILTFDDGFCNNYNYASPILEKYGMKAVISVIGKPSEETSAAEYRAEEFCSLTWEQIREMAESGLWEIQNHTWDFHDIKNGRRGASRKNGETEAEYEALLSADLQKLQGRLKSLTGTAPNTFTWPFGAYTEECRPLLKALGFKATLSCNGGVNRIKKGDTESLYLLKRNLRDPESPIIDLLQ